MQVTDLFTDRLTGQLAIAVTAPISPAGGSPMGVVAVVIPVGQFAASLAQVYGGPQRYVYTVQTAQGKLLSGTMHGGGRVITGRASVAGLGWILTARQSRDAAVAGTRSTLVRLGVLIVASLALLLALLIAANRRIGRPLRRLTAAAAQARQQVTPEPVPNSGPAELRRLADEFNAMIAARVEYERQLSHHVLHDPLTGLPNRALCLDRIGQALQANAQDPSRLAVVSVDLDRFKVINASLGYLRGNEALVTVANRLAAVTAPTDTLARSGGDGFVICHQSSGDPHALEGLVANVMDSVSAPLLVGETEVTLTASMGIAYARTDSSPEDLVRDADTAMYAAKEAGGGRYRFIDDDLRMRSSERLALEADLRTALSHDQLHLEYQPVVDITSGQIMGVEALLRWSHPVRGSVPPMVFVPLAEEAGIIGKVGAFVLSEACRQTAEWVAAGHDLRVAVNVSGLQLHDPGFVASVAGALHLNGLVPPRVCLELTETTLMDDRFRVSTVLEELKHLGVQLSIDDFGTGYSSLAYLQSFPVDELKVDQSFVRRLGERPQDETLVAAMVAMGKALGLHVIAEGVETPEQLHALLRLGCTAAQGYLLSRPVSAEKISQLLDSGLPLSSSASAPHDGSSGCPLPGDVRNEIHRLVERKRLREEIALCVIAAELAQPLQLMSRFDTLRDGTQSEVGGQVDHCGDDTFVLPAHAQSLHKSLVDLDEGQWKAPQMCQRGVAGAEVVQSNLHAEIPQSAKLIQNVLVQIDDGGLGELQVQCGRLQIGLLEGLLDKRRQVA